MWLVYFTYKVFNVYTYCSMYQYSIVVGFLFLFFCFLFVWFLYVFFCVLSNSISLYGYTKCRHLSCSHVGTIENNSDTNTCIQVFAWTYAYISPEWIYRSRTVGSHGMSKFNFLRDRQTNWTFIFPPAISADSTVFTSSPPHVSVQFIITVLVCVK